MNVEQETRRKRMPLGLVAGGSTPLAALELVHRAGLPTCQLYAPPSAWRRPSSVERIKAKAAEAGIAITSVICTFPGEDYGSFERARATVGFVDPQTREARIKEVSLASEFTKALGIRVLQGHAGFIPAKESPDYERIVSAVRKITDHLKESTQCFALETGQESAEALRTFIDDVDRENLRVNFDPANFIIYDTDTPFPALKVLREFIVGVHCKDATRPRRMGELGREVPLGQGDVDFPQFISGLKNIKYRGALTIEREIAGEQQMQDIRHAKALLELLLKGEGGVM